MRAAVAAGRGVVTGRRLLELGIEARQVQRWVRSGVLVRLRRGVYTTAELWAGWDEFHARPLARIRAAHASLTIDHAFSHDSSAVLRQMRLLRPQDSAIHIARQDMRGRRSRFGIEHHGAEVEPSRVQLVDGLPAVDLARTVVDLAREHGYRAGLVAADGVLAGGLPRRELELALGEVRGWPFSLTVRAVVEDADEGSESVGETLSRELVATSLGARPETQFPVLTRHGVRWADLRVGRHLVEFDGRIKYRSVRDGGVDDRELEAILWEERRRGVDVTDEAFGLTRLVYADHFEPLREAARERIRRDYADTTRRYGTQLTSGQAAVAARLRRLRAERRGLIG